MPPLAIKPIENIIGLSELEPVGASSRALVELGGVLPGVGEGVGAGELDRITELENSDVEP
jgi:hypothetical protein